ncbi:hypothetical protein C815_01524 [Firmicutes bacterium M10-2]|nr:hypothetical protein C815_01524 [Firmicutes bacterium M10-2]
MRKFKIMFDKDKEIEWLDEMCRKGWAVKRFKYGLYTFEPCAPGEYIFDTDLNDKGLYVSQSYRDLLEEMDIEFLCSSGFWFLVRRKAVLGPFELYTDYESKIAQYRRIRNMFKGGAVLELLLMYIELGIFALKHEPMALILGILLLVMFFVLFKAALTMDDRLAVLKAKSEGEDVNCIMAQRMQKVRKMLMVGVVISCLGLLKIFPSPFSDLLAGAGTGIELVALIIFGWRKRSRNMI